MLQTPLFDFLERLVVGQGRYAGETAYAHALAAALPEGRVRSRR